MVDRSGNIVNNYEYDEWGNILNSKETVSNPFKYTCEVYDQETGLYYLNARYYDPKFGRFINEDTYEGQITNPLSLNVYSYYCNNPLIYSDPSGHVAIPISISISVMRGFYATYRICTSPAVKKVTSQIVKKAKDASKAIKETIDKAVVQKTSTAKKLEDNKSVNSSKKANKKSKDKSKNKGGSSSNVPIKDKVTAENGLDYQSNPKHILGQPGNRPNAGIEPKNSLNLFNESVPSSKQPGVSYTYDKNTGTLHRFFSDNNGTYHWSGSTIQGPNSLTGNEVPNDIKNIYNLPKKEW